MTRRRSPRAIWLVAVGALVAVMIAAVLVLPRITAVTTGGDSAAAAGPGTAHPSTATSPAATLRLVGFGDSVMTGTACDCEDFLSQVGAALQQHTGRRVVPSNHGANGETTAGLLHALRTRATLTREIAHADVIVVTIGANDLGPALASWDDGGCPRSCYQPRVGGMANRLKAVLTEVNAHRQPTALVLVTSYWNVFEDGDVGSDDHDPGYLTWSDQVTRSANTAIDRTAGRAGATVVDLYAPFKADGSADPTTLLAPDGDHPNAAGTRLIATAVTAAIEHRLQR